MRLQVGEKAPYAPGQVVVDLIRRQRQYGNLRQVDASLLARVGVSESLQPRTLASLRQLGLLDESGQVTDVMEGFKRGSDEEYRAYFVQWIKDTYGEVFDVLPDVSTASEQEVETAFRAFEPAGQRARMVVLFLSLCREAGLVEEGRRERGSAPKQESRRAPGRTATTKPRAITETPEPPPRLPHGSPEDQMRLAPDPLIAAYVAKLPPSGTVWSRTTRAAYLNALSSIFDIVYTEEPED